jgi:NADP-dependent 3-hydroxy acid dehydrogenase YdfG
MKCNVLVWSELRNVFTQAKSMFGHVDIVFANAGVVQSSSIWDDKLDENGELAEPEMLTLDVCLKSVVASKFSASSAASNEITYHSSRQTCDASF